MISEWLVFVLTGFAYPVDVAMQLIIHLILPPYF